MAEEVDVLQVASHLKLVDLVECRNKDKGRGDGGSYYQGALTLVPTRKAPRMQNILFKLRHGTESWVIAVRPNRGIISPRDESVTLQVKIRKDGFQENNSEITVQLQSTYWEDEIGSSEQDFNDAWNSLKFKQANIAKNLIRISIQDDENNNKFSPDLYPPSPPPTAQSNSPKFCYPSTERQTFSSNDYDDDHISATKEDAEMVDKEEEKKDDSQFYDDDDNALVSAILKNQELEEKIAKKETDYKLLLERVEKLQEEIKSLRMNLQNTEDLLLEAHEDLNKKMQIEDHSCISFSYVASNALHKAVDFIKNSQFFQILFWIIAVQIVLQIVN